MPNTYKVTGQAAPAANTDTEVYKVPAAMQFVKSTLTICNRNTTGITATFRVAVVPKGETLGNKHYIYYETPIESRGLKPITLGITMNADDKLYVRASTGDLSFSLFGCEIS